ncbi:F-box/WD repeat-containing protein 7-like [Patiria miniata]|uniref:F-box domain-containing protein n=1 Tax=Patiria miniata TaxID=46514 RepID=A0A914BSX7_PATMI|nr:F-box/WD repeat-containing protein 7-like [Patiria miniata]XP_038079397.1 F-box/WD repeat-containing protein 7-like [Patiria miniata]XP_038079398.1 F-box/WD repeat-containing protein 7-like [Patiria miniata]
MNETEDKIVLSASLIDDVKAFLTLDIPGLLPEELTERIFRFLSAEDLCRAAACSRAWRERTNNDVLWHWLCKRRRWERYSKVVDLSRETPFSPSFTDISHTTPTFHFENILTEPAFLSATCNWKQVYMRAWHLERNWCRGRYRVAPVMRGHREKVTCLDCNGTVLVSGSVDKTVRMWNLISGKCTRVLDGHTDAVTCLRLKDDVVVTGCSDGFVRVYDTRTGRCQMVFTGHERGVECLCIEGDNVISASSDRSIRVWSLSRGICTQILRGHSDDIEALSCMGSLVVSTSWDMTLKLWDIGHVGECLHTLQGHTEVVFCCQFDERIVVSGSGDGLVKVWSTKSGECLRTLEGHDGDVYCLCFNDDVIASGSADSSIRLWSHAGELLRVMREHIGVVRCMCLLGDRLVSGGDRKKIVVWNAKNGDLLNVVHRNPSLLHIMWMNDTRLVTASPESPGTLTVMSYW